MFTKSTVCVPRPRHLGHWVLRGVFENSIYKLIAKMIRSPNYLGSPLRFLKYLGDLQKVLLNAE